MFTNYSKKEIAEMAKSCVAVEFYTYMDNNHASLHTDSLQSVDIDVEDLPEEITADVHCMDMEDYDNTVLANVSVSHQDFGWSDGDKVLVVILEKVPDIF